MLSLYINVEEFHFLRPRSSVLIANHLQVVFLGFLGFANVYAMRVNLSVAIVYMVNHTAIDSGGNGSVGASNGSSGDVCPMPEDGNGTAQHLHDGKASKRCSR